MSSIVIASVPVHGHVTPLLAVAEHLIRRGDDVRFLTGTRFADKVAATGATHVPLPAEADYDDRDLFARFPEREKLKGIKALAFDVEHVFVRPARAQYNAIMAALADRPADAVLAEPMVLGATFLLHQLRPMRPALVICGVVPLYIDSRDTAPFGMGLAPTRHLNQPRNRALSALQARLMRRPYQLIDDLHLEAVGTRMPYAVADAGRHADALVQFTVPSFEYPRSDAPANLHFAGPLSCTGSTAALPDWWPDLDGTRPVVHVTQGTVANTDYDQAIGPTLRALADEDVFVAVSTGGRPLDTLPPLPPNARAATFLPYDELLPRTDVFVTNGGYGGVQYALRYGVPIVATGGKEDKPEVGARVAWTGVGRRIRSEKPSPKVLRRHILAVLDDPSYRQASALIGAEMAAASGFTGLTDVIDGLIAQSSDKGSYSSSAEEAGQIT
ncbi:MAG: glycosyltransferase family 1 protein [Mycolicibacterium cosmeticum]|nr:glycosyltransferase family 1 protein [Mycolicibacterium cosmeticum]